MVAVHEHRGTAVVAWLHWRQSCYFGRAAVLVEDAVGVAADSSWPDEADAQRHLGALAAHSVSRSTDAAVGDVVEAIGAVAAGAGAAADVERAVL